MTKAIKIFILAMFAVPLTVLGQSASPTVAFYSVDEEEEVVLHPEDSHTTQAPLEITMDACLEDSVGWRNVCQWDIFRPESGETTPIITRFEPHSTFTLTNSGAYDITLTLTCTSPIGQEYEYSYSFSIAISESSLKCPDGFSPNNDGINDNLRITCKSIVKLDAIILNRWGQQIHHATLDNSERPEGETDKLIVWDGYINGRVAKDGVYFINLHGVGSDGLKYKIKKAINVLKGFREITETDGRE